MNFFRAASASLLLASLLAPGLAAAQTATVTSVVHADGDSTSGSSITTWYVNAADCAAPGTVSVNVSVANATATFGSTPQIWIGTNCATSTARSGTNATCMQAQTSGTIEVTSNGYEFTLDALVPAAGTSGSTTYDLCNSSGQGSKTIFILPSTLTSGDPQTFASFTLTSDLTAPSTVTVTTTAPSGDNAVTFEWDTTSSIGANEEVYFFALPGGCGAIGGDAGTTDAGTTDGGTATGFAAGLLPPVGDSTYESGATGGGDSAAVDSSDLGLVAYGDTVAVGFSVKDAAGNYSVLSNIVCATRVQTYGLCDVEGDCPQGGCAVSDAPVERGDLLVAGLGTLAALLVWRRRR